jgi:hypothetical protein
MSQLDVNVHNRLVEQAKAKLIQEGQPKSVVDVAEYQMSLTRPMKFHIFTKAGKRMVFEVCPYHPGVVALSNHAESRHLKWDHIEIDDLRKMIAKHDDAMKIREQLIQSNIIKP